MQPATTYSKREHSGHQILNRLQRKYLSSGYGWYKLGSLPCKLENLTDRIVDRKHAGSVLPITLTFQEECEGKQRNAGQVTESTELKRRLT